jgi:Flp pilus assembly pilin Flp
MTSLIEHIRSILRFKERAATTVEYALIAALLVGGSALILGALTDSTTTALETRGDNIGNPDEYVAQVDPGGDTGGVVGDDIIPPPAGAVAVHLDDITNRRNTGFDPKWQASVDIEVDRNSGSEPTPGVHVFGQWRIIAQSGTVQIQPVDCIIDANGTCTMTAGGLRLTGNKDQQAWFEYSHLVVDTNIYSWNPADDTTAYGTPPSVLVCDPNSTLGTDPTTGLETCT